MSIDSKDSLVWLKSMARAQSLPLDSTEVFSSVEEAQTYASTSAVAYAGQTVKALGSDGEYSTYILQPSEGDGYSLEELSAEESSQPVVEEVDSPIKVVTELPKSDQEEGVLYIVNSEGYVWSDSSWNRIFHDQTSRINEVNNRITITENRLDSKIASSKSTAVTEATAASNTAREIRIGEISADTTVKAYIDEAFAASKGNETLTKLYNGTISSYDFPKDTNEIRAGFFAECRYLALTSLPDGVYSIEPYTFYECHNLKLTSLDNVNSIGDYAFYGCSSLNVTSLGSYAHVGSYAFCNCSNLALTSFPEGVIYTGRERQTKIPDGIFKNCSKVAFTSLPYDTTEIGNEAFYYCSKLALTSLPRELNYIGESAFDDCSNLALTSLPDKLSGIGYRAFSGCEKLALTSLPNALSHIGPYAFYSCTSLVSISLPNALRYIDYDAFSYCTGLKTITFTNDAQTPNITIASDAFDGCTNLTTINVPWAEGAVANAPWGATNATINYNYVAS